MDKLSDRVMALEGPSFTIEQEIGRLINPQATRLSVFPAYTASLDAAMSLVPEGWQGVIHIGSEPSAGLFMLSDPRSHKNSRAATPALALCAAALRLRGL